MLMITRTGEFGTIVGHDSDVSTLSTGVFDPQGHYRQVIEAVEQLGYGKTRIYRVKYGKTRVEYYVVVFDHEGARVVGLKAKAVES